MVPLLEVFKILCTDFDHILEKTVETIQGGILFKGGNTVYNPSKGVSQVERL